MCRRRSESRLSRDIRSSCCTAGRWLLGLTLGFVWMGVSSGLIILNKQLMSKDGFHYPMALSALGMSFSSVASYFCCRVSASRQPDVGWLARLPTDQQSRAYSLLLRGAILHVRTGYAGSAQHLDAASQGVAGCCSLLAVAFSP